MARSTTVFRWSLAQQVAELNALYESAPIGLAFFDRDYRYVRINRELASINGLSVEDHDGRTLRDILPVNAPQIESVIDKVFATGEAVRDLEVTGETPQQPGVERHWLTGFYPVSGDDGTVEAVGAWVVEISERKAAEQREVLLAREVDHRAKNLLAVVQAIVTLTPMGDGTDLKTSVVGRIQALARAHSLLSESRWDGVDLRALVEEELAPFKSPVSPPDSHRAGRRSNCGPRRPSRSVSCFTSLRPTPPNMAPCRSMRASSAWNGAASRTKRAAGSSSNGPRAADRP